MENDPTKITSSDKVVSVGLEFIYVAKKVLTDFVCEFKKDLQIRTTGNKKQRAKQKRQDQKNAVKKIAKRIDVIKWPPQHKEKLTLVLEALQLIKEYKKEFNMTEREIGQAIYDEKPLGSLYVDNEKASVILDIIRYSRQHQSKIEAMYGTHENYLVDVIKDFYEPPGNLVMWQIDKQVKRDAVALYKEEE